MSAKSKKRLCKSQNKLLKLENLQLKDVICPICQSILTEPVTLPCFHDFCQSCFNGSVENNALCCPLCRLRIGSWLRTRTKQNNLVNIDLWNFIKSKFAAEINGKLNGDDINPPEDKPILRLSTPGEIKSEYEAELQRLKTERLEQERRQIEKTELLIKKIQQEEYEAQKKYLERLKEDELLAKEIVKQEYKPRVQPNKPRQKLIAKAVKSKFYATAIDKYLTKIQTPATLDSPILTDDNTSTSGSTNVASTCSTNRFSPEVVPRYPKAILNIKETILRNKENGRKFTQEDFQCGAKEIEKEKTKDLIKSLPVSLPLPSSGILHLKTNVQYHRNAETGSVDSMRQELCFFKPIDKIPTGIKANKVVPVRVPAIKAELKTALSEEEAPSRLQYLDSLCRLRNISFNKNLPSAFVIALNILQVNKVNSTKYTVNPLKRPAPGRGSDMRVTKKIALKKRENALALNSGKCTENNLRRTRSMGSIIKDENETTPKKAKVERKVESERKPRLRSDTKKICNVKRLSSPISEAINNNKVNVAVKNLSSPLKDCDVKQILGEQLRIEYLIRQEKKDLELARQMDAELNGRRHLQRAPGKRQVTLNYALKPNKKVRV